MSFHQPGRGAGDAYDRYLRGMDAAMRQKVALTAAHLLGDGAVADLGTGSGAGADALAALYPRLRVTGVDVDPEMVGRAAARFSRPNLDFIVGDAAAMTFPAGSMDGIFDSSILHHVTSYGGYAHDNARRALAIQAEQLARHGVLIVRDFVAPDDDQDVLLDLPDDDGEGGTSNRDAASDPVRCSTAALLRRFAGEFRSLAARRGFPLEALGACADRAGWQRFRLSRRHAVEFLLRKDYRTDWIAEVQEEYTYFDQRTFERVFAELGLRVLASIPLRNPWIIRHRLAGKYRWTTLSGATLGHPATNYLIVGERVDADEGVAYRKTGTAPPLGFVERSAWRRVTDGAVRDLARRPNPTLDVVPWFDDGGELYVLARMSHPRPVLAARDDDDPPPGGRRAGSFVTEPLTLVQGDKPIGQTVSEWLVAHIGLDERGLRGFRAGTTYYPSPGGIQEEVRSVFVELAARPAAPPGGEGRLGAIAARQVLRAAQVGGLPDARLELNVYDLLIARGEPVGEWIGDSATVPTASLTEPPAKLTELFAAPPRRRFASAPASSAGYLSITASTFAKLAADGRVLGQQTLEWVAPRAAGLTSVAVAVIATLGDVVCLGLDDDDLPAAQCFTGNSNILVAPAWRVPRPGPHASREIDDETLAAFARGRLAAEHGLELDEIVPLGGPYHPSPGLTPELVVPLLASVRAQRAAPRPLRFVPLADCVAARDRLPDGHLRVVLLRAAHVLGLLNRGA